MTSSPQPSAAQPVMPAQATGRPARPPRPQVVLEVVRSVRLGPHLVRLTLGGPGFAQFQPKDATDQYVKLLFADPALGLTPPYDMDALRETLPMEKMPVRRTYTVRAVDRQAGTIDVDFVVHGDEGLAGPWAANAQPGDTVVFSGPGGNHLPDPEADWHLIAGDESAIPAIAATLEAMPSHTQGVVLIEVPGPEDELQLTAPEGIEVRWLHRGQMFTPETTQLAHAVMEVPWRDGTVQVFAHGEREMIKDLRRYLSDVRGVDRRQMSLSAYWAYGRAEETFQAEKREPIGKIFPDRQPPAAPQG